MRSMVAPVAAAAFSACTTVPMLEHDEVAVAEIVQRVKCELAFALPQAGGKYPTGQFQWLSYWTAKVDLTLEVTDTSSASPSASFIDPRKQAVLPGIGNFQQSFNFGAAANITGTAYRNDKLSFTVSILEVARMKLESECVLPQRRGILGRLGLEEWFVSALGPVKKGVLDIGYHEPPTGKSVKLFGPGAPAKSSGDKAAPAFGSNPLINESIRDLQLADKHVGLAKGAMITADELLARAHDTTAISNKVLDDIKQKYRPPFHPPAKVQIQQIYDAVDRAAGAADDASAQMDVAKTYIARAMADSYRARSKVAARLEELKNLKGGIGLSPAQEEELKQLEGHVKRIDDDYLHETTGLIAKTKKEIESRSKLNGEAASAIKKIASSTWELMPRDPPLDSIAHTVKFTVVAGANLSPNWSLVRFKGPTQGSNPLLSAQRTRIHTLDLVLGSPATPGGKGLSDEQKRQLLNLKIDQLRVPIIIDPSVF
jgi:hypothetical protein